MNSALDIDNLTLRAFLASEGKQLKFSPAAALADRPEDTTFFRFQYNIDGPAADGRIQTSGNFNFQFCLRIPQHIYYIKERKVEEIFSSARKLMGMNMMEIFMPYLGPTYSAPTKTQLFPKEKDASDEEENDKKEDRDCY